MKTSQSKASSPSNRPSIAPVESFFSSLKNELVRHRRFQHHAEARYAIAEYIEVFYNRQRLHQALGYRSPEFELR
jgi:transposase InsO family protein